MLMLCLGVFGFVLYVLYDINGICWHRRSLDTLFAVGTVCVAAATAGDLWAAWKLGAFSGAADVLLCVLGLVFLAALVYCLFFALPFEDTYLAPQEPRRVYTGGAYALCRHPGVLCFFAMYLCFGAAALPGSLLRHGMVFSLLNVLYVWFQDRVTFPRMFTDYGAYRKTTPFLIPTIKSIRRAIGTWPHSTDKEDSV